MASCLDRSRWAIHTDPSRKQDDRGYLGSIYSMERPHHHNLQQSTNCGTGTRSLHYFMPLAPEAHSLRPGCPGWVDSIARAMLAPEDTYTTAMYHPHGYGVVERGHWDLGDALTSLLLQREELDWDIFLPQTMRSTRAMLHCLMFNRGSRPIRLEILISGPMVNNTSREQHVVNLEELLDKSYEAVREIQRQIKMGGKYYKPWFKAKELAVG